MISEIRHKEREDCIRAVFFFVFFQITFQMPLYQSGIKKQKSNQGEKKDEQKEH